MGIFDAAQSVVAQAVGVVVSDATVDISTMMDGLEERLMDCLLYTSPGPRAGDLLLVLYRVVPVFGGADHRQEKVG